MGSLVYDLGNLYLIAGHSRHNGHLLVDLLRAPRAAIEEQQRLLTAYRHDGENPRDTLLRLQRQAVDDDKVQALLDNVALNGLLVADASSYHRVLAEIDMLVAPLDSADMQRSDADLVQAEYALAADFLRYSARRSLFLLGERGADEGHLHQELEALIIRYRANWLARNRPGGLDDSVARFNNALET